MTSQVTDVLEAVQSFIAKGYDREYRVKDGNLVDLELGSTLDACSIRVDAALRLESGDDGEDASNIYAITDPATEHKGLLIDAFDVFHEICPATCPSALWRIGKQHRQVTRTRRASTDYGKSTRASFTAIPSVTFCARAFQTSRHALSANPSASSASIPPSRNMSGSSRASFEILG
ncbi:hypothetical protein [Citrobacter portucalensis]|jgi:hypothetical protein|uniref:Uncharacterized protein n=1 Tax=Escherichia coli TaxID=562 RepID=A0A377BDN5_ECOLX|nr:hypothetical protein [Citrobacter portucalensis]MDV1613079.1 hypothetical protein [Citrobacter portucalensis]MEB0547219.1 hypothetical protein [Citrobacter portucalensis]STL60967.1 Uncharacterised protein [Escherichia coli]